MNRSILLFLVFMTCASTAFATVSEKPLFGPKQYDIIERHGLDHWYQETFSATKGVCRIKLQHGENTTGRSEYKSQTI